jgi:hypothetical protein
MQASYLLLQNHTLPPVMFRKTTLWGFQPSSARPARRESERGERRTQILG